MSHGRFPPSTKIELPATANTALDSFNTEYHPNSDDNILRNFLCFRTTDFPETGCHSDPELTLNSLKSPMSKEQVDQIIDLV